MRHDKFFPGAGNQSGIGYTVDSVFFSPRKPTWVDSPDGGPRGWGARLVFTLLFPK